MALIKKHKVAVEETSVPEKQTVAQTNSYNSNAQKISEFFTQEEVASKYGNYNGVGNYLPGQFLSKIFYD